MILGDVSFSVFDVETTGLYPYSGDRICEIGAIRFSPGRRSIRKFHQVVDPERPISRGAFSVNGITEDMVRGKPTIGKVLPGFLRFIEGSVLVAYNAGFDLGFLECSLGERRSVLEGYRVIDALSLARRIFPGAGRYNLGSLARTLGIAVKGEHRAMADAYMTLQIFRSELGSLEAKGVTTLEEVIGMSAKKSAPPVVKDYTLGLIEAAINRQKKLNIVYRSSWDNGLSERVITPKRIHRGYDRAYVVAHCHLRNEERNFRLDCIVRATPDAD